MIYVSKPKIVSFFNYNGLVPAWGLAKEFADEEGRIATLPEIVEIRLNSKIEDFAWKNRFTTSSAEYFGIGKDGQKKIIVAHGIGPMSDLDGILKAYSYEFKDKTRNNHGGRITQEEFLSLESGQYGPVKIVDYRKLLEESTSSGIEYPLAERLSYEQCLACKLLIARLGPNAEEYINFHSQIIKKFSTAKPGKNYPKIILMTDNHQCSYCHHRLEEGLAMANLLSVGQLENFYQDGNFRSDIRCHEWSKKNNFIGIRKDAKLNNIDNVVDVKDLLEQLMVPVETPVYPGTIRRIIEHRGQEFVEYQKNDNNLDTGEPEFHVISKEPIGKLMNFQTTTGGSSSFFKYDQKEISIIAPPDSNAYKFFGEIKTIYKNNKPIYAIKIQFYRAEIDYSQRLIHASQLANNYDKLIELIDN